MKRNALFAVLLFGVLAIVSILPVGCKLFESIGTVGAGQVTLPWDADSGATSHVVYQATKTISYDPVTNADTTTTALPAPLNQSTVAGLTNGTKYHFVITAVGANGESQWSAEVTATTVVDLGGGVTMTLAAIPAGTFTMGSPDTEGDSDERPQRQVTLTKGFYMGTTEVTQAQWLKVMGSWPGTAPSTSYGVGDTYPAYNLSWYDAVRFCNKLSTDKGLPPCYTDSGGSTIIDDGDTVTCSPTANGYRLPTEAEWEHACRAGTTTMFYWGASYDEAQMKQYGWYEKNAQYGYWTEPHAEKQGAQPVGTRLPNAWGLYDMSGNLWEWCWDWYGSIYYWQGERRGENSDPRGPVSGSSRVQRGGSWDDYYDGALRSAGRDMGTPTDGYNNLGFRLLRIIP